MDSDGTLSTPTVFDPCLPCFHAQVYYDVSREAGMKAAQFVEQMSVLGSFSTMSNFLKRFGNKMGLIAKNATLRVFKATIKPIWEDPGNAGHGAGKWTAVMENKQHAVAVFKVLVQGMVCQTVPSVNGVILTQRQSKDVIMIWTDGSVSHDEESDALRELIAPCDPPATSGSRKKEQGREKGAWLQMHFRNHQKSKQRNKRNQTLNESETGSGHARTASLEVSHDSPFFSDLYAGHIEPQHSLPGQVHYDGMGPRRSSLQALDELVRDNENTGATPTDCVNLSSPTSLTRKLSAERLRDPGGHSEP